MNDQPAMFTPGANGGWTASKTAKADPERPQISMTDQRAVLATSLSNKNRKTTLGAIETLPSSIDLTDTANATLGVFDLMCDGLWHKKDDIQHAAERGSGGSVDSYLRRMRELRSVPGWDVRKRLIAKRTYEYRLTIDTHTHKMEHHEQTNND